MADFTIGDVIRKARIKKRWNQTRLGHEAQRCVIVAGEGPINKSTVSKVEKDPYSSEFGTVWRITAAVGLSLTEIERGASSPFLPEVVAKAEHLARQTERQYKRRSAKTGSGKKKMAR